MEETLKLILEEVQGIRADISKHLKNSEALAQKQAEIQEQSSQILNQMMMGFLNRGGKQ